MSFLDKESSFSQFRESRRTVALLLTALFLSACSSSISDAVNPSPDTGVEELGERTNRAILGSSGNAEDEAVARQQLTNIGTSRQADYPSPNRPVIIPPEVRLMWIPDRINRHGDLEPAHYYYLRVLPSRWNVEDAFDNQGQLDPYDKSNRAGGSSTPWVIQQDTQ